MNQSVTQIDMQQKSNNENGKKSQHEIKKEKKM